MDVPGQSQVSYADDDADQLRIITQGTSVVSFAYDDAGRRTSHTLPNGIVTEYTYDPASRFTALTYKPGGNTLGNLSYGYNDAGGGIAHEPAGGVTTNSLVWLGIDERFVRSNATETRDLLIDALGSTSGLGDGSGSLQASYKDEAFGVSTTTGALSANPCGYTGRES